MSQITTVFPNRFGFTKWLGNGPLQMKISAKLLRMTPRVILAWFSKSMYWHKIEIQMFDFQKNMKILKIVFWWPNGSGTIRSKWTFVQTAQNGAARLSSMVLTFRNFTKKWSNLILKIQKIEKIKIQNSQIPKFQNLVRRKVVPQREGKIRPTP